MKPSKRESLIAKIVMVLMDWKEEDKYETLYFRR
jgi:hypothetical protein